ncbi:MAG TPA: hypothetical protein VJ724_07585 [Tahibacter sp.]|nr:hypothetical protein [Tahibacter sp.]
MRQLILAAALAFAGPALATDGALDDTFGTDAQFPGYGFYVNPNGAPNNSLDTPGAVVPAQDGKLWLVGRMKSPGAYRLSLYRVQANGYPDVDFGDLGLRTVVGPCTDFSVGDATRDAQDRLLVAINNCADFIVYRFLPNGDLDANFAAGGVLTVPFDQGGDNQDLSQKIATTPDGDIVVAGTVTTAATTRLGIARYTSAGLPKPGFGANGKVQLTFEWSVPEIFGVNGLHVAADGRIVVAGAITESAQAVSDKKQFVVRLLAGGGMDPSFGNVSPGLSKINLKAPLGVTQSPWTYASLLEPDGSVIQVGKVQSNQVGSDGDVFLLRWRPDGQLDTGIGPNGVRQYALDFAGPNPADPADNWEAARTIARQSNGDYVIAASCYAGEFPAVGVLRLKRDFSVDTRFGNGGKIRHLVEIGTNGDHGLHADRIALQPGRIVLAGSATTGFNGRVQTMVGLQHDSLFADTFD